jgi:hypothetical protein
LPIIGFSGYFLFKAEFTAGLMYRYLIFMGIMGVGLFFSYRRLRSYFAVLSIAMDGVRYHQWGRLQTHFGWGEIVSVVREPATGRFWIHSQEGGWVVVDHRFAAWDEFKAACRPFLPEEKFSAALGMDSGEAEHVE